MNPIKPSFFCAAGRHLFSRSIRIILGLGLIVTLGMGCSPESRKDKNLQRADEAFAKAQYEKALDVYKIVLQQDPECSRAMSGMGLAHYAKNDLLEAFPYLGRAVELNPKNTEIRLKLATIYFQAGEYGEVRKQVLVVLAQEPNNFDALKLWATSATTPEEVKEAFDRLNAAAPAIQDKSRVQLLLGRLYQQKADLVSAEQAFKSAQELDPGSQDAHLILGDFYVSQGRTNLAGHEFEAATRMAPTNAMASFEWADFKRKTGELEESKKLLAGMVQRNPEYVKAWYRLAQIAASEGDFKDALKKLSAALKIEPDYLEALALKARVQLAEGHAVATIEELNQLAKKYRNFVEFQYLLASGYAQNKEPAKAINAAQKAASLAPNYTDAILLLTELRIRTGDAKNAVKPLLDLVGRKPDLVRAQVLLGSAYLASQEPAKAVAAYRKVTELIPLSDRAYYLLALASLAQNDLAAAAASLEKSLSLNPRSFDALARLVDLHLAKKEYPAAVERIQKQIVILPGEAPPYLLLGRVYLSQGDVINSEIAYRKAIALAPDRQGGYQMLSQILAGTGRVPEAVKTIETALAKNPADLATLTLAGSIYQNKARDFSKAAAAYKQVLAAQPDSAMVANNLASLYLGPLNDKDKAYDYAAQAYKLAPEQPAIQDTLGWCAYQQSDYKRALRLLNTSAAMLPKEPEIAYHLGMTQAMIGQEGLGEATLQRALALGTNFPGADCAALTLAVLAVNPENVTEKDRPALQALLKSEAGNSSALFRLALLADNQKDLKTARKSLEALLEKNPDFFPASIYLADIYSVRDDDQPKALLLAKKARETAVEDPETLLSVAAITYRSGEAAQAKSLLNRVAGAAATNALVQYHLAMVYYESGSLDDARVAAAAALKLKPDFQMADKAQCFLEMLEPSLLVGDEKKAADRANVVLAKHPGFAAARMVRAALHQKQGDAQKAASDYQLLLKENPYFAPALKNLVLLRSENAPTEQDFELAAQARKLLPEDPEIARALAAQVYDRKDYRQAMSLIQESNRKISETAESLCYLGLCRYHLGDKPGAKQALRRASELDAKISSNREVLQIMMELQ